MPDFPGVLNFTGDINAPGSLDTIITTIEVANNVKSPLLTSIDDTDLLIPVTDIDLFTDTGIGTLHNSGNTQIEIFAWTSKSGSSLVVPVSGRGLQGTIAQSFTAGMFVSMRPTKRHHEGLGEAVVALETYAFSLKSLVDTKAAAVHTHAISDVTGLSSALTALATAPGSNHQVIFNDAGSYGAAAGFNYGAASNPMVEMVQQVSGTLVLHVREATTSATVNTIEGVPGLLNIKTKNDLTMWGLMYWNEAASDQWANFLTNSGTLVFEPNSGGAIYMMSNGRLLVGPNANAPTPTIMAQGRNTWYAQIQNIDPDTWAIGIGHDVDAINTSSIYWDDTTRVGINQMPPTTAQFSVTSGDNARIGAIINSAAAPTADIFEAQRNGTNVFQITASGSLSHAAAARSGTQTFYHQIVTPADTTLTASTESVGIQFGGNSSAATVTRQFAAGALTTQRENVFVAPTYGFASASTITVAATLAVTGPPIAGTNATLTNRASIYAPGGNVAIGVTGGTWGANTGLIVSNTAAPGTALFVANNSSTPVLLNQTNSYGIQIQPNGTGILIVGGTGVNEIWKDTTPTKAVSFGLAVPGNSITEDLIFARYNGLAWSEMFRAGGGTSTDFKFTGIARSSGSPTHIQFVTPADTTLTASVESIFAQFGGDASAATVTRQFAAGPITTQREVVFVAPTYGATSGTTITLAATAAITGAPVAGTNVTITNPLALYVATGTTQLDGGNVAVRINGTATNRYIVLGYQSGGNDFPGIWFGASATSPSLTNYSFLYEVGQNVTLLNGTNGCKLRAGNTDYLVVDGSNQVTYTTISTTFAVGASSSNSAMAYIASSVASRIALRVDSLANSTVDLAQWNLNADDTNTVANLMTFAANSNGTAAAGFGQSFTFTLESSTTNDQTAMVQKVLWATATHASRAARAVWEVYDTAAREALRIEASGSAPMIGFFGHAAAAKSAAYTPTNVSTDRSYDANATTLDEVADVLGTLIADLQSYGLIG